MKHSEMQRTLQVEPFNIMRNVRDAISIANLRGQQQREIQMEHRPIGFILDESRRSCQHSGHSVNDLSWAMKTPFILPCFLSITDFVLFVTTWFAVRTLLPSLSVFSEWI
jgi:hypothetical protein